MLVHKLMVTNKTQDLVQENVYYDAVGPNLPPPKMEGNIAYEKGQTSVERSQATVTLKVEENVAYGVHIPN